MKKFESNYASLFLASAAGTFKSEWGEKGKTGKLKINWWNRKIKMVDSFSPFAFFLHIQCIHTCTSVVWSKQAINLYFLICYKVLSESFENCYLDFLGDFQISVENLSTF